MANDHENDGPRMPTQAELADQMIHSIRPALLTLVQTVYADVRTRSADVIIRQIEAMVIASLKAGWEAGYAAAGASDRGH